MKLDSLRIPSRCSLPVLALAFAVGFAARPVAASETVGSVRFTLGVKSLDTAWKPVESQSTLGTETAWGLKGWPVLLALDALVSNGDGVQHRVLTATYGPNVDLETSGSTREVAIGLRTAEFKRLGLHPYLGAGGSWIRASANAAGVDRTVPTKPVQYFATEDHDQAFGYWVGGGLRWRAGKRLEYGFSLRYSAADVEFKNLGIKLPAGGTQYGLTFGWSWPR